MKRTRRQIEGEKMHNNFISQVTPINSNLNNEEYENIINSLLVSLSIPSWNKKICSWHFYNVTVNLNQAIFILYVNVKKKN